VLGVGLAAPCSRPGSLAWCPERNFQVDEVEHVRRLRMSQGRRIYVTSEGHNSLLYTVRSLVDAEQ
jgi:hypothetical protein